MYQKLFENDIEKASLWLKEKKISSFELTKLCFDRIKEDEDKIGAFLCINEENALKCAKESDDRRGKSESLGKLDGIPLALKDMILTTDMPTTAGSLILKNYKAPYEATVTKRLRQSGAVIVGKNNQDEFAFGSSTETSAYKLCYNPWNLKKTPGGSSGGSAAAVCADMVFGSLGTDTGGSIRQPASYCGVVGLKPTYGRVSRYGVVAFASSLDQVGPFAKTVKGCATILSSIAGYDENDSTSSTSKSFNFEDFITGNIKGKTVGVPKEYFQGGISEEVEKSVRSAIELLREKGAKIVDISLPHTPYAIATYYIIATAEASSNLARYDGIRFGPSYKEATNLNELYEKTRGEFFGPEVKRRIALGTYVLSQGYYDAYYLRAQKVRRLFAQDFLNAFKSIDIIFSPTTPSVAFDVGEKIQDPVAMYLNDIYTIGANLAGLPGISIPIGFDKNNMPIGAQILARPFDESSCFDFAYALEQELKLDLNP